MSGISAASGALDARHGLKDAITAALAADDEVDQYFGFMWPVTKDAWVALTSTSGDVDPKTIGPRRSLDETITFHVSIGAWVAGHTDATAQAAFDRAFGLLNTIQEYIRTGDNITLGGTVLWCVPGSFDSDGIQDEDGTGYTAEIDATFVCAHRVRSS